MLLWAGKHRAWNCDVMDDGDTLASLDPLNEPGRKSTRKTCSGALKPLDRSFIELDPQTGTLAKLDHTARNGRKVEYDPFSTLLRHDYKFQERNSSRLVKTIGR